MRSCGCSAAAGVHGAQRATETTAQGAAAMEKMDVAATGAGAALPLLLVAELLRLSPAPAQAQATNQQRDGLGSVSLVKNAMLSDRLESWV